jgi:hypothetical protein
MHHLRNVLTVLALGVAVVTLTPVISRAAEPPQPGSSLARVNIGPISVDWLPAIDYERLVLTIVGPGGFESRQELERGQSPSLTLFTSNGERLPDGVYRYELRLLSKGQPTEDSVQRGGFLVRDGGFVKPSLTAERTTSPPASSTKAQIHNITGKDSVVADDLVVQGTACIGSSCVNGDPNSNTLTLKGITPRIFFHDLNADCNCYPARNWLLQANLNYPAYPLDSFFLQDLLSGATPFSVQGGAQDDTLVVSLDGKVGIGTEAPLKSLHIVRAAAPTVRLEQPVSPGPARTWDVGADNTQFFVSDVTASTQPLLIRAGAPNSSIDVAASGSVGIGTASPTKRLTIKSAGGNNDVMQVVKSSGSTPLFRVFETTGGDGLFSVFDNTGAEAARFTSTSAGRISLGCVAPEHKLDLGNAPGSACSAVSSRSYIDPGSTTFTASSSRTIKENLAPVQVPSILDKISSVDVFTYDFIKGPKDKIGLMAEDFHAIFGRGSEKEINGQEVEMALWLAVQELTAQNKELSKRLAELENRLESEHVSVP